MELHPLTLGDKTVFDSFASKIHTNLASYAFAPLYVWGHHFEYYWSLLEDHFCVLAKYGDDYFLPILPIGKPFSFEVAKTAFHYCFDTNKNPQIARIENVPESLLSEFEDNGYRFAQKETEYIYRTEELVNLSGDRYKSKRNAYNVFVTCNPSAKLTPYCNEDLEQCLALYESWQQSRSKLNDDEIYRAMLADSADAHRIGITHAQELGLIGRVVRIQGEIRAYTFGFPLNSDVFCVLFEISDLNIHGLAQFIYREFCREITLNYKWINAMDDSGLANLKRVKLSYHPRALIPSYTVYENRNDIS